MIIYDNLNFYVAHVYVVAFHSMHPNLSVHYLPDFINCFIIYRKGCSCACHNPCPVVL
jgi:hypothetical protein